MEGESDCWPLTCAHVRLCDLCKRSPAVVTCKADAATLCVTCDADIHAANPLARRHERVPMAPLYGPATTWQKEMAAGADLSFFADADPFLDLEYEASSVPGGGGVGSFSPPAMTDFAFGKPGYHSYNEHLMSNSISLPVVGVVPDAASTTIADMSNPHNRPIQNPTATMDREARVMRYREKRKNRKFEKTIRYASRKAYAESRPRIKGRFAKRVEADSDTDLTFSFPVVGTGSSSRSETRNGYGVVPTF